MSEIKDDEIPMPRPVRELRERLAEMARDPAFYAYREDGPTLLREVIAALKD